MPYVMNALPTPVSTQALGKWFSFGPEQIKMIHEPNIAHFLVTRRGYEGIVGISDATMEKKIEQPEEYAAEVEEARKSGIAARVQHLNSVISNLEISLRKELEMKNIKADPLTYASKGEVAAYREIASLESSAKNKLVTPADEIRAIKEKMNGPANVSNSGTPAQRSPNDSKATKS